MAKKPKDRSPNWGGKREGAGRKKGEVQRHPYSIRVTDEEQKLIRKFLDELRNGKEE